MSVKVPTMLPHTARKHTQMNDPKSWCQLCCRRDRCKAFFRVRDGPVTWHFCEGKHYSVWLYWRQFYPVSNVLKLSPQERNEVLKGDSIGDYILKLLKNGTIEADSERVDELRDMDSGGLSVP